MHGYKNKAESFLVCEIISNVLKQWDGCDNMILAIALILYPHDFIANIIKDWQGQRIIYLTEDSIRFIIVYIIIAALLLVLLVSLYWLNRLRKLRKKLELSPLVWG